MGAICICGFCTHLLNTIRKHTGESRDMVQTMAAQTLDQKESRRHNVRQKMLRTRKETVLQYILLHTEHD